MKKTVALLLAVFLMLSGCHAPQPEPPTTTETIPSAPETTISEDTTPTTPPTTEETQPHHSELYIDGLSTDAVILYFEEICLDAEVINSGDPSRLQKWVEPITYQILGDPTQQDLEMISQFTTHLNSIPGFPGMWEVSTEEIAAMDIFFCTQEEMAGMLGDWVWGCDGGVTFWYDMDEIYSATICIRTDIAQEIRNSVILEEIYNGLGPVQDTDLREDSLIWSGYSAPQWPTEEDTLLLTLLYHPDLKPGMNMEQCAEVIRGIYY